VRVCRCVLCFPHTHQCSSPSLIKRRRAEGLSKAVKQGRRVAGPVHRGGALHVDHGKSCSEALSLFLPLSIHPSPSPGTRAHTHTLSLCERPTTSVCVMECSDGSNLADEAAAAAAAAAALFFGDPSRVSPAFLVAWRFCEGGRKGVSARKRCVRAHAYVWGVHVFACACGCACVDMKSRTHRETCTSHASAPPSGEKSNTRWY